MTRPLRCKQSESVVSLRSLFLTLMILSCVITVLLFLGIYTMQSTYLSYRSELTWILHEPNKLRVLDPWDDSLKSHFKNESVSCANMNNIFYVDNNGLLRVNASGSDQYDMTSLKCVYHKIQGLKDSYSVFDQAVEFEPPIFIESRVFRVACTDTNHNTTAYDFVHSNILWNARPNKDIGNESDDRLSVVILGFDSVSRSHALRNLPMSYKYLTETLGAYDLKGYRRVGENTYPNIVPLVTGKPSDTFYAQNNDLEYMDSMPFLWKESKEYVTLYSEDMSYMSTFNYHKLGFNKQPTDFYFRTYASAMDDMHPILESEQPEVDNTDACYGDKDVYHIQIDYFKRFMNMYPNHLRFAFFWNNVLSHDDFHTLGRADEPLLQLLQLLNTMGHLDRSILVVGSDHGYRLGGASTTKMGRLELDTPFMTVYIPPVLLAQYPRIHDSLVHNTDKLVTPYDIYETMRAVMYGHFSRQDYPNVQRTLVRRSLFEKIPSTRTCADGGIPDRFCTSLDTRSVDVASPLAKLLANHSVNHINRILANYTELCHPLKLLDIKEVQWTPASKSMEIFGMFGFKLNYEYSVNDKGPDNDGRYTLLIRTKPNEAVFEVVVDHQSIPNKNHAYSMTVVGLPIRLDSYGDEGNCIDNGQLEAFCFCFERN